MIIFVKTGSGMNFALAVEPADTVAALKAKISEREDIPVARLQIIYQSKPLPDETTVADAGIGKEATIHLILRDDTPSKAGKGKGKGRAAADPEPAAPRLAPPGSFSDLDDATKARLLASFASGADHSRGVDIVFCFDTTGSMSSVLGLVRQKVAETVRRLFKDIPKLQIGIMNLGDYCDPNPLTTLNLSSDKDAICHFVNHQASTGGGDAPEAYELALREARSKIQWRDGSAKALVMIGDEAPHPPSYTTENIDWKQELDMLADMGVKVYGVHCLDNRLSKPFYERLSERSGTVCIPFNDFRLITDMFLAICYRESSPQQLEKFKEEIKNEGKLGSQAMANIMDELSKPNPEKKVAPPMNIESKLRNCDWWSYCKARPQYTLVGSKWRPFNGSHDPAAPPNSSQGWLSWLSFGYLGS